MQLAIYSPADRLQPHRYKADESYEITGPEMTPVQSYLDVEAIIALAKQQSVDAIHPGYGFLSENTTFARRCGEEGIVFIGPTAKTIEVSMHLQRAPCTRLLQPDCCNIRELCMGFATLLMKVGVPFATSCCWWCQLECTAAG